ncbi:iron-siderophore ABC transporter substrate-binding protein [Actinomyces sp. ZJ308]|uniref:ABC transporter substrate-binding protein n=1 Tax=Actinomyces sp. ZJ308 TaxID=2708342 RepID=UPI001421333C|nr:iron-siderophore ABC transporter substrate-binding protein [Actinomyces sp. ZJ308]
MTTLYSRRSALAFAGLATALPVLAACSSNNSGSNSMASSGSSASAGAKPTPTSSVPTGMPEGKGSGQADDVFPRTVVHFKGSAEIPAAPTKVVVIATGQLDAVLTLGTVPVGSTKGDGAEAVPEYIKKAFPQQAEQLGSITDIGSRKDPSVEAVSNLAPDLILMNAAIKKADEVYAAMSAIAPTVVTQGTGQYWKQDFLLVADALGKPDTAEKWIETYQADAAKAGSAIEGNPTVSLLRHNEERLRIFGPISTAGSVLADMGVARPDTQQFTDEVSKDISAEQLEQANADWLFYGVQGGDASKVTSLDLWQALNPVDAKQAVQVDDDAFFLNAGPTAIRAILTQVSDSMTKK